MRIEKYAKQVRTEHVHGGEHGKQFMRTRCPRLRRAGTLPHI